MIFHLCSKDAKKLSFVNFEGIDTDYADSMISMFEGSGFTSLDLSNFNTTFVSDFTSMFKDMTSLQTLNIPWSTDSAINMTSMFENCGSLYSLNISTFETPKIEKYDNIFKGAYKTMNLLINGGTCEKIYKYAKENYPDMIIKDSSNTTEVYELF
jgi:surface protein